MQTTTTTTPALSTRLYRCWDESGCEVTIEAASAADAARSYRTRSRCVRWLDEHHPVGEWRISLPANERARVLALWGCP